MPTQYDQSLFTLDVDDPDNVELIEMFLEALPERISALTEAADAQDYQRLRSLSHQLKGAAPGFGCDRIGVQAAALETHLKSAPSDQAMLDEMQTRLDALIESCRVYIDAA